MSRLLVDKGCLFSLWWGRGCSLWDDSIDFANIAKFFPKEIPDDQFVMTTFHEKDSLEEVVRAAKFDAAVSYCDEPLNNILVLDFTNEPRGDLIEEVYNQAI